MSTQSATRGETFYAADAVRAVLYHANKHGMDKFAYDQGRIQQCFLEMKRRWKNIFQHLEFRTRGLVRESPLLDQVLSDLGTATLGRVNEYPKYYVINSEGVKRGYEKYVEPKLESLGISEDELTEISNKFRKDLSVE